MDDLDLIKVNIFRVTPQHGQDKVVRVRNRLVYILEKHVEKVLYPHIKVNLIKMNYFD